MKSYTICSKGGVRFFFDDGSSIGCAPNSDIAAARDNLLNSMKFVAELIAGEIDNKSDEADLQGFIVVAVEALNVLSTRLKEAGTLGE